MLRRPPTSIELKLDDIREYEAVRQQLLEEKKQNDKTTPSNWQQGPKSKEEVYARIGYVPPSPDNSNTTPVAPPRTI